MLRQSFSNLSWTDTHGSRNFAGIVGDLSPITELTLEGYEKGLVSVHLLYHIPVSKSDTSRP